MSSAIDYLFANMKCSKCGKPAKEKCKCWEQEPIKNPVTLKCTECPATIVVEDEPDFMDMKLIVTICPECAKDPKKKAAHDRLLVPRRGFSPNETSKRGKKR